jgi:hypothetical protein
VVHGVIMAVQALADPDERGHLVGDVPALFIVAIVLGVLMWRPRERCQAGSRSRLMRHDARRHHKHAVARVGGDGVFTQPRPTTDGT